MSINIVIGWWLVPWVITAATFVWAWNISRKSPSHYGQDITGIFVYGAATIASLVVWLVWAVLT